jgi:hypothetical protein
MTRTIYLLSLLIEAEHHGLVWESITSEAYDSEEEAEARVNGRDPDDLAREIMEEDIKEPVEAARLLDWDIRAWTMKD